MKKNLALIFTVFIIGLLKAQTTNIDFELSIPGAYTTSNAISGWTVSSQTVTSCNTPTWAAGSPEFSIHATPLLNSVPLSYVLSAIPNSPLGGTRIAQLNSDIGNSSATKLARTYSVSSGNSLLQVAYAGAWESYGPSICCEQAGFKILLKDAIGAPLSCFSLTMAAASACIPSNLSYSITIANATVYWTGWQTSYIDLSPFTGSVITIEIISSDCVYAGKYGTLFFDALFQSPISNCFSCLPSGNPVFTNTVNYCSGSGQAQICGPAGYAAYSWSPPQNGSPIPAAQSSLSCITVMNPVVGSVYTLNMVAPSGCMFLQLFTIAYSNVSIIGVGSSSTCAGGSSGSATVAANGSGTGYNYSWTNSTNSVVSTNSVATGLSAGVYSVQVSAIGSSGCGTALATVTISSGYPISYLLKPFCGNEAYFTNSSGSNFQWYNSSGSVTPAQGGNTASYTLTAPVHGSHVYLGFNSIYGCRDTIVYTLVSVPLGSLAISSNPVVCPNTVNGLAVISLTPSIGSPSGLNYYSVVSTGTTSPYSSTLSSTALNTFTATGLTAGGTYSINAFDGSCKYTKSFSVTPSVFDYTVLATSQTLCSGASAMAMVSFTSPPSASQYTYSWSPSTFLFGTNAANIILSPSINNGSTAVLVYSVTVTPTLVNCPIIKTISFTAINPATPTLFAIPLLCSNSPTLIVTASTPGGSFTPAFGNPGMNSQGIITPTIASIGINTFTYYPPSQGTCTVPAIVGNYTVFSQMFLSTLGNQYNLCSGQSTTLNASGAGSYSWSTGATTSSISISPAVTTTYNLLAMNTSNTCSQSIVFVVTVTPIPMVSISGPTILCTGNSLTLIANGASSYTWSTGSLSSFITETPGGYTVYTVTGSNSSTLCGISTGSIGVSVFQSPTLSISGNTVICKGQSATLLANGASSYAWSNSSISPFISISPLSTSSYTVIGTDLSNNCPVAKTITVLVVPQPTLIISGDTLICKGETTTLTVSGANNYNWNTGASTSTITVSPNFSSTYTVNGTSALACSSTRSINIMVVSCNTTGISSWNTTEDLHIYPNPNTGKFFLETNSTLSVTLTDPLGKKILSEKFEKGNYAIDLSNYANGVYILKAEKDSETKIIKVLKN